MIPPFLWCVQPGNPMLNLLPGTMAKVSNSNQLSTVQSIFVDKDFSVYVVDNLRIQRWDKNATYGVTVAGGNGKGTALNQFYAPVGVWVDEMKNVYVSDYLTERVVKWAPGATSGVIVAGGNGSGSGANQFFGPEQICLDKQGNLYVADRWNDRVQKWAPGATAGITVAGGNGRGSAANQLREPYSIALDTAGNLFVADTYNQRIQKWSPGATTGVTVAGGNGNGQNANQLSYPTCVAVDSAGNIFTIDNANYRVQKWEPGQNFGITVAGGHGYGRAADQLGSSWGLAIDRLGRVYVSEISNYDVKRFTQGIYIDTLLPVKNSGKYKARVDFLSGHISQSNTIKVLGKPGSIGGIQGPKDVVENQQVRYRIRNSSPDAYYSWEVPFPADIVSGQGTKEVVVNFGSASGYVSVVASNICGSADHPARKYVSASPANVAQQRPATGTVQTGVFPNPASNSVTLAFTSAGSMMRMVEIADVSGRVLLRQNVTTIPGSNRVQVDISSLLPGIYALALSGDNQQKVTYKVIKR